MSLYDNLLITPGNPLPHFHSLNYSNINTFNLIKILFYNFRNYKICTLAYLAMRFEENMYWLKTLGGGYSSLGYANFGAVRMFETICLADMH